jgi:hypothetical protein
MHDVVMMAFFFPVSPPFAFPAHFIHGHVPPKVVGCGRAPELVQAAIEHNVG